MKKPSFTIITLALLVVIEPVFPRAKDAADNDYSGKQSTAHKACSDIIDNFTDEIGKIEKSLKNADKTSVPYKLTDRRLAVMRNTLKQFTGLCRKGLAPDLTKTLQSLHLPAESAPLGGVKSAPPEKNPGRKTVIDALKDSAPLIKPLKAQGLPSPGAAAGYPEASEPAGDTQERPPPDAPPEYPEISEPAGDVGGYSSSIGEKGAALIAGFEGSVRNPEGKHIIYYDQGGLPTIGYGHLITNPVEKSEYMNGITEFQALALFRDDLSRFENAVRRGLTVQVNQAQFDALVSLAYNIGIGAFSNSELLGLINARADISEIEAEWKSWNKVTIGGVKQVSQGLKNRRELEWRVYSTGEY